ncbi:MAG: hypothetical protein KBF83_04865 [Pyrinomonadaceae bacterium]|nr:hypothetical protein [Pyrinomonadaceae bacterium]MBP9108869.1 hypothetical protein [Pyrinomonadaceae bacterium]
MKHPKFNNLIMSICLVALAAIGAIAQQAESSYDLTLHLVVGSNEAGAKAEMPSGLEQVTQDIKSRFGFSNYRLATTLQSRILDGGGAEYKSPVNIFGETTDPMQPSFMEMSVIDLRNLSQQKGAGSFQGKMFRFGAKVPVATGGSFKDETGKSRPITAYEHIGLTLTKFNVPEGQPTLVGTLNLPGTTGTIFLVMTIKSV